ncbi:molybdenum cofactor guanylyltransferase [Lysinibacillus sp. ZYM-1]|uniref:molybdenum cofactor guanylyltransferase n=1 Tax=Lysinibacillus sp. ZYM-1 TaxID=1681184 RepID=UPI0006CE888F|nr:molybdenum cofactor guanylyltransferase [Lysinibacillus sp. ZYM-1]KPN95405.1 molybdopterin-guanine dinucleotide biosynthesis protein MobA [Lysinibacillus sp. ZYM-1]
MKMAGVVLAGGQSSRYGLPKMFETFAGLPLYKHSLNALQENQLNPLVIATNASLQPKFDQENVQWIIEQQPHQGPLFALHHIMTTFPDVEWFFVVASDMPYMNAGFIQEMLGYIDDSYDAIVPKQASRYQPLAALYRRTALPKAKQLTEQNKRSMKVLLDQLRVCYVPFDDNSPTFININAQQDWAQTATKESNYE